MCLLQRPYGLLSLVVCAPEIIECKAYALSYLWSNVFCQGDMRFGIVKAQNTVGYLWIDYASGT